MRSRLHILLGLLILAPVGASAQGMRGWRETSFVPTARGEWKGPVLPDGQPDVSGHWSNTIGNHNNLTDPQGPLGADDEAPRGQNGQVLKREPRPGSGGAPARDEPTQRACSKPDQRSARWPDSASALGARQATGVSEVPE